MAKGHIAVSKTPRKSQSTSSEDAAAKREKGRSRNACDRCKQKKVKCDGEGLQTCSICAEGDFHCHYAQKAMSEKKQFRKGYVEMVEEANEYYKVGLHKLYDAFLDEPLFATLRTKELATGRPPTAQEIVRASGAPSANRPQEAGITGIQRHLAGLDKPWLVRHGEWDRVQSPSPSNDAGPSRSSSTTGASSQAPRYASPPSTAPSHHNSPRTETLCKSLRASPEPIVSNNSQRPMPPADMTNPSSQATQRLFDDFLRQTQSESGISKHSARPVVSSMQLQQAAAAYLAQLTAQRRATAPAQQQAHRASRSQASLSDLPQLDLEAQPRRNYPSPPLSGNLANSFNVTVQSNNANPNTRADRASSMTQSSTDQTVCLADLDIASILADATPPVRAQTLATELATAGRSMPSGLDSSETGGVFSQQSFELSMSLQATNSIHNSTLAQESRARSHTPTPDPPAMDLDSALADFDAESLMDMTVDLTPSLLEGTTPVASVSAASDRRVSMASYGTHSMARDATSGQSLPYPYFNQHSRHSSLDAQSQRQSLFGKDPPRRPSQSPHTQSLTRPSRMQRQLQQQLSAQGQDSSHGQRAETVVDPSMQARVQASRRQSIKEHSQARVQPSMQAQTRAQFQTHSQPAVQNKVQAQVQSHSQAQTQSQLQTEAAARAALTSDMTPSFADLTATDFWMGGALAGTV